MSVVDSNVLVEFIKKIDTETAGEQVIRSLKEALNKHSKGFLGLNILRPDFIKEEDIKVLQVEKMELPNRPLFGNLSDFGELDTIQIRNDEDYIYRLRTEGDADLGLINNWYFISKPNEKMVYYADEFLSLFFTLQDVNKPLMDKIYPNGQYDELTSHLRTYI